MPPQKSKELIDEHSEYREKTDPEPILLQKEEEDIGRESHNESKEPERTRLEQKRAAFSSSPFFMSALAAFFDHLAVPGWLLFITIT